MKKSIFFSVLLVMMIKVSGQNPYLELTFTAVDNATHVQLDSIKIMNRTQNCDTVLYSPDTLLLLGSSWSTHEYYGPGKGLKIFQNYPNPVFSKTTIPIYIPDRDELKIIVTDVLGRVIVKSEMELDKGMHSFRFAPAITGLLFFTTQWRGETNSIRILSTVSRTTGSSTVEYKGNEAISISQKTLIETQNFTFSFGDELLYIGYTDNLQSGVLDAPANNETYTFQFATNIPCPGTPTVVYEGQVYNTIQIFSQCWMKENLNYATGNSWCYEYDDDNCIIYGRLYDWETIMNGEASSNSVPSGVQGICPNGWHVPSDEEWKILEGTVDTQYGVGNSEWDGDKWRGQDAGKPLKTQTGWIQNTGTDAYGLSVLPGGYRFSDGTFYYIGEYAFFWSSSAYDIDNWYRGLTYNNDGVYRQLSGKENGISLRCVKD